MREGQVRFRSNRRLIFLDGFRITAQVAICVTEFVMRFGIITATLQCRLQVRNGVVVVFLLVVDLADLIVRAGVVSLDAQGLLERNQSGVVVVEFLVRIPQLKKSCRVGGLQ